jgi:GTP pyrophosphokinase
MSNTGNWIEVQIRSERMDAIAERGIAAHWTYKQQGIDNDSQGVEQKMDHWLDMVRDVLDNPDANALKFLDKFHESLLGSEIYVFTPKVNPKHFLKVPLHSISHTISTLRWVTTRSLPRSI